MLQSRSRRSEQFLPLSGSNPSPTSRLSLYRLSYPESKIALPRRCLFTIKIVLLNLNQFSLCNVLEEMSAVTGITYTCHIIIGS